MTLTLPKAKSILGVILSAPGTPFITRGTINLSSATPSIKAISTSSYIGLKLNNISTTPENKTVTVYLMMAPTDLSGKDIEVYAAGYKTTISGKNFEAGLAYSLYADLKLAAYPDNLWVDMGLPSGIKWASQNVGAINPEDYGDYFAWGEILPKEYFYSGNSATYGKPMGDITGNALYDVATAIWGNPARIPTKYEIQELLDYSYISREVLNGVKGVRVYSNKNGNSIFLPLAGFRNDSSLYHPGEDGQYWCSTPWERNDKNQDAYSLVFDYYGNFGWNWYWRGIGFSVRPVRD